MAAEVPYTLRQAQDERHDNVPFTADEAAVKDLLVLRLGAGYAMTIAEIRAKTGLAERAVKGAVEGLIMRHGYKIGSSRGRRGFPPGYYLIEKRIELDATCRPLERQALAMLARVCRLRGKNRHYAQELVGQMVLEPVMSDQG